MISLSPVKVCRGRSRIWKWWHTSNQDRTRRYFSDGKDRKVQVFQDVISVAEIPGSYNNLGWQKSQLAQDPQVQDGDE